MLNQRLANFHGGPDSKYFGFSRSHGLCGMKADNVPKNG